MPSKQEIEGELKVAEEAEVRAKAAEEIDEADPDKAEAAKRIKASEFVSLCPACHGSGIVVPPKVAP